MLKELEKFQKLIVDRDKVRNALLSLNRDIFIPELA